MNVINLIWDLYNSSSGSTNPLLKRTNGRSCSLQKSKIEDVESLNFIFLVLFKF